MATANRGSSNLTASGPAAAAPAAQTQPSLWSWFHPINWITALITYAISFSVYVYTLQPTVGLEDSGELIAGAYRLGVPHPPGYPLWTIVAKLFTFIPVGDPAWRVNLFSAVCGALAASFVTLVLAKSGDLLFAEQEEELGRHHLLPAFERIGLTTPRLVNSLCAITAGVLFAMTPGTWSQSTIAEVYAFNAFFMALVVLLSLVLMFNPQRRNVFIWITVAFALGITVHQTIVVMIIALGWLAWSTRKSYEHFFNLAVNAVILAAFAYYWFNETPYHLSPFNITDAKTFWSKGWFFTHFIGAFVVYLVAAYAVNKYWFRMTEWPKLASAFLASLCVYFYLPVASASNPCMNWGRARTVEGFWHSICRGQYEKPSFRRPLGYFTDQVMLYLKDTWDQYPMTLIFAFVSILALVLVWRKTRLRDWLIYSVLAFLGCGIGMVFLMNPKLDITSQYINRVFFIMGHAGLGLLVGYGMITVAVALFSISRRAENVWRHVALAIGAVFVAYGGIFALCSLQKPSAAGPLGRIARSISVPPEMHFAFYALFGTLFMLIGVFVIAGVLKRRVSHAASVGIALCVLMTPFIPAIENWDEQNLRSKYFGFVFGVEMMKVCEPNTIFFGGTDPGRFVPEYMCGCSEFRADIYLITQNGLADATYMNVLRDRFCKPKHVWPWARKLLGLLNADREDYKEGVNTIYIPSQEDFERAFQIYIKQVEERRKRGEQIEEDVRIEGGKVSVGGVAGVMRLNGILAEMIWSNNTNKHAFYVEESYVIPWMYPYLEPAGLIMKLNASPVTLTPEKVAKDVAYWNNLEKMFTEGGHIDYEDINVAPEGGVIINNSGKYNFVDRRAKRKGRIVIEKGEFADDVTAQKSFSKARSASAGVYEHHMMWNEAENGYMQAIRLYPQSAEAYMRLANMYMRLSRFDDAYDLAVRYKQEDPLNDRVDDMISVIRAQRDANRRFIEIENGVRSGTNVTWQDHMELLQAYEQRGNQQGAQWVFDKLLAPGSAYTNADGFRQLFDYLVRRPSPDVPRAIAALERVTELAPGDWNAWLSFAAVKFMVNDIDGCFAGIEKAIAIDRAQVSRRLWQDPRFQLLRESPDPKVKERFQNLVQQQ